MLYLAVSHFGRGRGSWQDPINNPARWEAILKDEIGENVEAWDKIWKKGGLDSNPEKLRKDLEKAFRELISKVFIELYPDSAALFSRK